MQLRLSAVVHASCAPASAMQGGRSWALRTLRTLRTSWGGRLQQSKATGRLERPGCGSLSGRQAGSHERAWRTRARRDAALSGSGRVQGRRLHSRCGAKEGLGEEGARHGVRRVRRAGAVHGGCAPGWQRYRYDGGARSLSDASGTATDDAHCEGRGGGRQPGARRAKRMSGRRRRCGRGGGERS